MGLVVAHRLPSDRGRSGLVARRPTGTGLSRGERAWIQPRAPGAAGAPAPTAPDDDPEFLRELDKLNSDYEHEQTLKQWEADLKRREEDLRKHNKDSSGGPAEE